MSGDPESEPALRLRITHIITSMAAAAAPLRSFYVPALPSAIPAGLIPHQLPILRVFGTTPSNQKICANVHLVYPYFYVPFPMDSHDPLRPERVVSLCQRFAVSLNHAICLALRQNPTGSTTTANFAGGTDPKHLHVIAVVLVKGVPFYGYHVGYSYFFKVLLANPARMRIATEQLRKPVVLGREWQPHEAHLSHVLQFMCDFNVYGCGTLDLSGGHFRDPLPEAPSPPDNKGFISRESAPAHMLYHVSPSRDTYAELEIDVLPHQIMNRNRLEERALHHDFVELLYRPLDPEEKLVPAMKELWEDERRRRAAKGLGTSEAEMLPVSGGGRGRSMEELGYKPEGQTKFENRGGDWKISEELWEVIQERMATESRKGRLTFDLFSGDLRNGKDGEKRKYDRWVMTTFQAVSAHWPKQHATQRTQRRPRSSPEEPTNSSSRIASPSPATNENPFEIATQASQILSVEAEVNALAVQLEIDQDEEEQREAVRKRAQEDELFRATQAFAEGDAEQPSVPATPRSTTPAFAVRSVHSVNNSGRKARIRQEAGLADLSDIMEMSSFALSSSPNPFAGTDPVTPTRNRTGTESQPVTPLVRNIFSRPRTSPTPHRHPATPGHTRAQASPTGVILPHPRRAVQWMVSPDTPSEHPPSPTPCTKPLVEIHAQSDADADAEPPIVPNAQRRSTSPTPSKVSKATQAINIGLSPTLANRGRTPLVPSPELETPAATPPSRPKKRVRLSSPAAAAPSHESVSSQVDPLPVALSTAQLPPTVAGNTARWTNTAQLLSSTKVTPDQDIEYQEPFYSNPDDVPPRSKLFAGRVFRVGTKLPKLDRTVPNWLKHRRPLPGCTQWWYLPKLPTRTEAQAYFDELDAKKKKAVSQLSLPTQRNPFGFKLSPRKPQRAQRGMSVLLLEVFAPSRLQLLPNPEKDEIAAVFFCLQTDRADLPDTVQQGYHAGYVVVDQPELNMSARLEDIPCYRVEAELDLINWVIDSVKDWDPDVLAGWELHNASWGYLAARAHYSFGTSLTQDLSRLITPEFQRKDAYSEHHTSTFKVTGRHVLNIWRILRSEVTLNAYTFENVVFHLLRQRIPYYTAGNLTSLWKSKNEEHRARVLKVFFQRVVIYAELIDSAEIISKNAEFARVFGVDFEAVIFRGSQFKVESFMFRIAKPENFVLVTPSREQVGLQNAPFAVPLIAEPESKYYSHPIVVLDFQSLYPSVMIAYNICFSTCLGRVEKFKGTDKFGFTELKVANGLLELLKDYLIVTPNGMIFVKPAVRKSLLAKMLGEILDTRVMVKSAMKYADKGIKAMLNARQLALKLMANVTYGYTSATYSGRMPCIEIADSIVQTGRETLEKAQELIHSRDDWRATVVYGDTDSLFISLPGRSKEQAFRIGHDIADAVTALNPKPVKLKFEKVYMGSVLMAKKRYVGFKYEHPDEAEPVFDAKGIETIRRDGFAAQQKMEEICLKMLFRTQDLSQIKEFCRREWTKILQGRVSIQDFIIAKEVRLGTYSEKGIPPPGAAVAYRRILKDPRDEPQYAERVPYIISNGPGRRLIDRAHRPEELLANPTLGIDAEYYIRNLLIPPLSRIFNLVGADVESWYDTMPRMKRAGRYAGASGTRIDTHFFSTHCVVCGDSTVEVGVGVGVGAATGGNGAGNNKLCGNCRATPDATAHALVVRVHNAERRVADLQRICASCASTPVAEPVLCSSIDCPVTYARVSAEKDAVEAGEASGLVASLDW